MVERRKDGRKMTGKKEIEEWQKDGGMREMEELKKDGDVTEKWKNGWRDGRRVSSSSTRLFSN